MRLLDLGFRRIKDNDVDNDSDSDDDLSRALTRVIK